MASQATSRRYVLGCVLVTVIGVALSKLLASAGLLPFVFGIVGVFFFMLVGLILGAILFRCGAGARPMRRGVLLVSVLVPTLAISAGTVVFEYRSVVVDNAEQALRVQNKNPRDRKFAAEKRQMRRMIESYWRARFAVGGVAGYVAWTLRGSKFKIGPTDADERVVVEHKQAGVLWLIRAVISFVALGWAMGGQVWPLSKRPVEEDVPDTADSSVQPSGGGPADAGD
jgi:hypothetical protein